MKASRLAIRAALVSAVSIQGLVGVAYAQSASTSTGVEDIIVTAQRQAQSLQDVPIAVSAFSAETLAAQQINNASQLQLTLPNITFSKGNFTGSSFTIRGVGDLCVGVSCDSATAIHLNDLPLFATRLFETEYFDLERVEVLRGPQGTLFGRNATAGVVNFVTGKPDASGFKSSGEVLYGNYNEIRLQGMVNIPLGENFAARVAGFYLKRDGYTENLFDGSSQDGRDMFALRGSLRWEPTDATTIDLMGYWFKEDSDRMRIQKQVCQRDPTGVLGCLPGRQEYGITNANSTFVGTLSSRELLAIQGGPQLGPALGALGLGSLYGPDAYANNVNPNDPRKVNTDYTPTYLAEEIQIQAKIEHDFGGVKAKLSGQFQENSVDSSQDYNLSVQNAALYAPGLNTLAAYAGGAAGPALQAAFAPLFNAALPNGANGGVYCTSLAEETGTGIFQGNSFCDGTPQDFDRSNQYLKAWTVEGIVSTEFDGKFNFLVGGIYNTLTMKENSYYVNSFGIDYVTGVLGGATFLGGVEPCLPSTLARPSSGTTPTSSRSTATVSSAKPISTRPTACASRSACATTTTASRSALARRSQASRFRSPRATRSTPRSWAASTLIRAVPATSSGRNATSASTSSPAASWSTTASATTICSMPPTRGATSRAVSTRRCSRSSPCRKPSSPSSSTPSKSARRTASWTASSS